MGRSVTAQSDLTIAEVMASFSAGPSCGVFTDGSARPNPGPGGWGAVYVRDGKVVDQAYGDEPQTTNNRMELVALINGFKMISPEHEVTVYSDSELCVNTLTKWAAGWKAKGWKRKGGPVKNLELVQELYELYEARPKATVKWIEAHNGWLWNEYADALSTAWARSEL